MVGRGASSVVAVMVLVGLARADAPAEPTPKPVDIKDYRDKLVILRDADGATYAVMNVQGNAERHVFYGTGKQLYEQILETGGRDGDAWNVGMQAPRIDYPFLATVERRKDGSFRRLCGEKLTTELTQITGDKAKEIIDKSQFLTTSMLRKPYLLARDDRGVYYYVDMLRPVYGGNGHRVFVGKKGALKQMALTDVTTDSAGDVFATKSGDLRLVHTVVVDERTSGGAKVTPSAQWIRGEKKNELIYLDIYMNQPLIYRELGLYKIPGTVCGNL